MAGYCGGVGETERERERKVLLSLRRSRARIDNLKGEREREREIFYFFHQVYVSQPHVYDARACVSVCACVCMHGKKVLCGHGPISAAQRAIGQDGGFLNRETGLAPHLSYFLRGMRWGGGGAQERERERERPASHRYRSPRGFAREWKSVGGM